MNRSVPQQVNKDKMAQLYTEIVTESAANFKEHVRNKVKDSNRAKSTVADPHRRTVITYPVHRHIFSLSIAKNFMNNEKKYNNKHGCQFTLTNLMRTEEILGVESILKMKEGGDKILVCPWSVVTKDISGHGLNIGRLVITLSSPFNATSGLTDQFGKVVQLVDVFVPCGGSDQCESEIPVGYEEIKLSSIIPNLRLDNVPLPGVLKNITIEKEFEFFNTPRGVLAAGDIISCGSERYLVDTVSADIFKPRYDLVSIGKNNRFKQNNKKRNIRHGKMPIVVGKLLKLDIRELVVKEGIDFHLKNLNKHNHGLLNLSYTNAVFNDYGYLTHDIAVVEGDAY